MNGLLRLSAAICAAAFAFAADAQTRICVEEVAGVCLKYQENAPEPAPEPTLSPAAAAERALNLTSADRLTVQRGLAAAGFYGGAIDGLIGAGSRSAIRRWQSGAGRAATGYLTSGDVAALKTLAANAADAAPETARREQSTYKGMPVIAKGPPDGSAYDLFPDKWVRFDKPAGYCLTWKSGNAQIVWEKDGAGRVFHLRTRSYDLRVRIALVKRGDALWGVYCN